METTLKVGLECIQETLDLDCPDYVKLLHIKALVAGIEFKLDNIAGAQAKGSIEHRMRNESFRQAKVQRS